MPRFIALPSAVAALLAALASLSGCAGGPAVTPRDVVVLGSSTTAGTGATSAATSWVGLVRLSAESTCPDVRVTNLGVGGTTTAQALPAGAPRPDGRPASDPAHNLDAALALHPALVFIQFPSNDAAQRYPLEETLANHVALRDGVRGAGAVEVIVGPFPRAFPPFDQMALMTGLRDALPTVGAPRYLPLWADLAMTDNQVLAKYAFGDGIHLNDAGHALIAQKILASDAWKAVCTSK